VWSGLAARIAITVGTIEFHEGFGAQGISINLAKRLLTVCPAAGVVLGGGAGAVLVDHPQLRRRAIRLEAALKDFGVTQYWLINGRSFWQRFMAVVWRSSR